MVVLLSSKSAIAQDMDASQMFGKNALQDGPIIICSDSLSYSQKMHQMIYTGNVFVMQTKGANIGCDGISAPHYNDKPLVEYTFPQQESDDYSEAQQKGLALAKKICQAQKGCRFLSGQKLTLLFTEDNQQIKDVVLTAKSPYAAKFYSLPFPKKVQLSSQDEKHKERSPDSQDEKMYAEGRHMTFNMRKNILTISDEAYVDRVGNRFSGDKILYDVAKGLVTVPNTGKRATIILNNLENK